MRWRHACVRPATPRQRPASRHCQSRSAGVGAQPGLLAARADYDRLIAAGDRLRSLQQQMLGGRSVDPRESMQERQAAVRQVVERAARFLADAGQPPTDATRQRIERDGGCPGHVGQPAAGIRARTARPRHRSARIRGPRFAWRVGVAAGQTCDVRLRRASDSAGPCRVPAGNVTGAPRRPTAVPARKPVAVESPAEKRAAARAAQEAARARESERRRRAVALQEAERNLRQRAAARERAEAARSRAAGEAGSLRKEFAGLEQQLAAVRTRLERAERAQAESDQAAADANRAHAEAEQTASRARRDLERLEE